MVEEALEDRAWVAPEFERHRRYLSSVAYRMLGSVSDAEDAVQECWLRLDRRPPQDTPDLRPWLTTVVGRICLDMLRARRSRREEYAGAWLPEPVIGGSLDDDLVMADSIGLGMLIVLETLSPAERLAFVLHDAFAVPFEVIADIVGRSPVAARQLASRGRRRVQTAGPQPDGDPAVQREVADAFLAASRSGDFEALLSLLDPDIVLRIDAGGLGPLARPEISGLSAVAKMLRAQAHLFAPFGKPASVNGGPGFVVTQVGRVVAVTSLVVSGGRICAIDIIADPVKLRRIDAAG